MAFDKANFAPVGNTSKPLSGVGTATLKGAPSVWSYASADARTGAGSISSAGYFNTVIDMLKVGDLIYCVHGAGSGGTLGAALLVVVSNDGTNVDTADGTAVSVTDTY